MYTVDVQRREKNVSMQQRDLEGKKEREEKEERTEHSLIDVTGRWKFIVIQFPVKPYNE